MKDFLDQYRSPLVIFGTMAFIGASVYFAILPLWTKNVELMNQVQSIATDREIIQKQSGSVDDLRAQSEIIRNAKEQLEVKVPKDEPLGWVQAIENLAKDSGVSIKIEAAEPTKKAVPAKQSVKTEEKASPKADASESVVPTEEKAEEKTISNSLPSEQYVPVRFILKGEYQAIRFFLEKIELLPFYADVLSLHISYKDPEEKTGASPNVFVLPALTSGTTNVAENPKGEKVPETTGNIEASLEAVIYTE